MIRRATPSDAGQLAYMLLAWDSELPDHVRRIRDNAAFAENVAAAALADPSYGIFVLEEDGKVAGCACVRIHGSLFDPRPAASLAVWYVLPKYRNRLFYGLRLLHEAIRYARSQGCGTLTAFPWADDINTQRVLQRLGMHEMCHEYMMELSHG